jgi:hypothetical protein
MSGRRRINLSMLLHSAGRRSTWRHSAQQRPTNHHHGVIDMGIMEGRNSKKHDVEQPVKAQKTPQKAGLNGLLETVRQKMAYTIRGI